MLHNIAHNYYRMSPGAHNGRKGALNSNSPNRTSVSDKLLETGQATFPGGCVLLQAVVSPST